MADGSDSNSATTSTAGITSRQGASQALKNLALACVFLIITIAGYVWTAHLYSLSLDKLAPYWPLEWLLIALASTFLASVIVTWNASTVPLPSVDGSKNPRVTWFDKLVDFLAQDAVSQISIGLFVTYGLFLITELFYLAESKPSLHADNWNIVRLTLSKVPGLDSAAAYFFVLFIVFFGVVATPILRNVLVSKKMKAATDVPGILTDIRHDILWYQDYDIPASKEDCAQVEASITETTALLEKLRTERAVADERLRAARQSLFFVGHSESFAKQSTTLSPQAFKAESADALKQHSLAHLGDGAEKSLGLANDWGAVFGMPPARADSLPAFVAALNKRIVELEAQLHRLDIEIEKCQAQLDAYNRVLKQCVLRTGHTLRVPVHGLTKKYEYRSPTVNGLGILVIVFLALNTFMIAPELGHDVVMKQNGGGSLLLASLLVLGATIPTLCLLNYTNDAIGEPRSKNPGNHPLLKGAFLCAVGLVALVIASGFILPGPPAPKIVESVAPTRMDVTCSEETMPKTDGHGIFRFWYLAKDSIIGSRVKETFDACKPAQGFDKTNYIVAVGVASQEDRREAVQNQLAADRAYKLMTKLEPTPASWSGRKFLLIYGQALVDPTLKAPPYSENHSETDAQRPTILLGGYLAPPPSPAPQDTLKDRYILALQHLNLLFFGKKPETIQPDFKASAFKNGLDAAAVTAGVDKSKYKLDCLFEVGETDGKPTFTPVGTYNDKVCPVPVVK